MGAASRSSFACPPTGAEGANGVTAAAEPSLFGPSTEDRARFGRMAWIIDFKTHQIEADEVDRTAEGYVTQVRTYRNAVEALVARSAESPPPVRIALHFTHPNVAREM